MAHVAAEASDRSSFPVFYDPSGHRWFRIRIAVLLLVLCTIGISTWFTLLTFAPIWHAPINGSTGYPEQLLATYKLADMPIIGEEGVDSLARVDRIVKKDKQLYLADPFSQVIYRQATPDEATEIADAPYTLEWFGHPPDHELVLTFDDGPDPQNTGAILDILSKEHVPATFFVIGKNVVKYPGLAEREIREGHTLGNHTLSHSGFGHGDARDREELIGADRVLRATADYATRLFRIPEGDPDNNVLAVLEAQQLGYITVDMDMDTRDWSYKPGQTVPIPKFDGHGHVVLMHDGGGDRSDTIKLLPRLIDEARKQGYTFTTPQSFVPKQYLPDQGVTPSFGDQLTQSGLWTLLVLPGDLVNALFWFGAGSMALMSLLYVVLALIGQYRQRQLTWSEPRKYPPVSVVVPCWNEEKVVFKTLGALARSDYPNFEIIAVDDGSTDNTWIKLKEFAADCPRLRIYRRKRNRGKAAALNFAVAHAKGEIIVTLDGDTVFEPQTIRMLARHFVDPRVAVVAGHVKVGNRRNIWTAWQSLEYISGICVTRMAEECVGAISIAPGACSALRKSVILEAGGYSSTTQAEDCDLILTIQQLNRGYIIRQENAAVSWTEAPMTIRALARQRLRWTVGDQQAYWKHRGMLFRPRYGVLGMIALPYALLSMAVPLVFMPLTYVTAVLSIMGGNWRSVMWFAVFVAGVHFIISAVAVGMVRERWWHLLVVPIYRLIYEPLRTYLLYASLLQVLKGKAMRWYRPPRTNSV